MYLIAKFLNLLKILSLKYILNKGCSWISQFDKPHDITLL